MKTCLVLETIGKEMEKNPDFTVAWLESEFSLNQDLFDLFKIDRERFTLLEITKEDAGEGALDITDSIITAGVVDMLVINSLKALVPSEEYQKNFSQAGVGVNCGSTR